MNLFIIIVIWAALIQGLLLAVLFISSTKYRSHANRILGFFLLTFVIGALDDLLPLDDIAGYSLSGYFRLPEVKIFLPILFVHFVLEKLGRSSVYQSFIKVHYILGFVILSLTLVNILLFLFSGNSLLNLFGWRTLHPVHMGYQYYAFVLTIGVFIISIKETINYRSLVRNEFTDISMLNINWLWQFIFVIAPIILFWGAELLRIALGGKGESKLTTIIYIFIAVFNYFVSFKAFTHQNLFDGSIDPLKSIESKSAISNKPKTTLDQNICDKIISEMELKKFYLNRNLTLHDLAKEIQVSPRTISKCINHGLGLNFNEWVNNYRVDKALEIIKSDADNLLSIEGIGTDAGFKSRSAMYAAFKKKLGHSPGYFKRN